MGSRLSDTLFVLLWLVAVGGNAAVFWARAKA